MTQRHLHQLLHGTAPGDAITDQALLVRAWLRELGFASELYAEHVHPALADDVRPAAALRLRADGWVVLHHSIGSPLVDALTAARARVLLIYHNVTPPAFVANADPALGRQLALGERQLTELRALTPCALADSAFNESHLVAAGFPRTGVLPIALSDRTLAVTPDAGALAALRERQPLLLFAGRLVPNKKQEHLVDLLRHVRRIHPGAQLALVGSPWLPAYDQWLRDVVRDAGLARAVVFSGHVTQAQYLAHFHAAGVYVSMSEHEGFGKPLVEGMRLGVPLLAYAAPGVAETVGDAGILFRHKQMDAIAELVDIVLNDNLLRARMIARGHARAERFSEQAARAIFVEALAANALV